MAQQPPPPPPPPQPGSPYAQAGPSARPPGYGGAATLLLVVGILGILYSLLILAASGRVEELLLDVGVAQSDIDAAKSVLVALGVVLLIVHALQIVGGWMLLRARGRGLAVTMAIIGGVIWLIVLVLGLAQGSVDPIGLVMALAAIACAITVPILLNRARMSPAA
jgi:hypothetical protein